MRKYSIIVLSVFLVISLGLIACNNNSAGSGTEGSDTNTSNQLSVYTSFPEQEAVFYVKEFEEQTGIKVNFVRLSAGETLARLETEKGNVQASVWYGGPSDTFVAAANRDLLEKYTPEDMNQIPEQYLDTEGYWVPIYVGAIGFAVNSDWLEKEGVEPPTSWNDLLQPEYKDNIMMAHPGSSGTAYTVLATLVQLMGEDEAFKYMNELNKNIRQYSKSGSAPAERAGLGETAVGIAFAHDILKPLNEGYPITLTFPEDGTGVEVGAVALIKNGPEEEKENAKKFIDWSISKEAQDLYVDSDSNRTPVNSDANIPEGSVKLEDLSVIDYDAVWAGENRDKLIEKFESVIRGQENLD